MLLDEALRVIVRDEVRKVVREELERGVDRRPAQLPGSDEYLSYKDAAAMAHVSVGTIRNWMKQDLLRPCGPGRAKRFRRSDIDRVMSNSQKKKDAPPHVADQVALILGRKKAA